MSMHESDAARLRKRQQLALQRSLDEQLRLLYRRHLEAPLPDHLARLVQRLGEETAPAEPSPADPD